MSDFEKNIDFSSTLMYIKDNTSIGGVILTSREILSSALRETGKTQAEAAANMCWSPQQLSHRLVRNTLRADDFIHLLDGIGVDVTFTVRETGKKIKVRIEGAGNRAKGMVGGVIYDTAASYPLANDFYADGINKYTDGLATELYMDVDGRYFLVEYPEDETKKAKILPINGNIAAMFIEKYGTELHKKRN